MTAPVSADSDLAGHRVLVTGGSMGIGLEVSRALARRGAEVVVAARSRDAIDAAVSSLHGHRHLGIELDVSDAHAWTGAMEAIDRRGELHGLVAAAGVLGPIGSIENVDPGDVAETISINVLGTMLAVHHAVPRLRVTGGRAVTFSGGGGTGPLPRYDAYATSKAAVVRFTENVAASTDVAINCVAPGFVATRMHQGTLSAGPDVAGSDYFEKTQSQLASGGFPASEAADLVCFLLSEDAAGISGKLLSAQWDPWREPEFRTRLRDHPELATVRRIDDQFFGAVSSR
jgi:3-oxoacyl-[acyl-carrier protein] reductase